MRAKRSNPVDIPRDRRARLRLARDDKVKPMLNYNDLRPGVIFILDSEPYQVLEYSFLRMQQRKPVVQTKIKNLINGKVLDRNFHQNETFEEAEIQKEKVKFVFAHRDNCGAITVKRFDKFVFCYENNPPKRFELSAEQIGESAKFLKPNSVIEAQIFGDQIVNIVLPIKMDFEVIEAPPSIKGNTASGGNKAVTIETGAKINAPLFIEIGDIIRINTQTGEYSERIKKRP